ncbi:MAG: hypothetical protein JWN22_3454 [Nocardioides sp.]|nr:hypothetical protein [Nocardioides sp.]
MSHTAPGSRSSRRTSAINTMTVLAVALPVLTGGALLLVHQEQPAQPGQAPTRTALTSASIICPSPLPGATAALLTTAQEKVSGRVSVASGEDARVTRLTSGEVTSVDGGDGPLTVTGKDGLAPGLVGARTGTRRLAAVSCPATSPDRWFTAVGAGARHSSVLELVNPDAGQAVADVTLYASTGPVDAPRLRGVSVPGRSSVRLDLAQVVPRRGELALHVVTSRGRLASTVLDSYDELGAGPSSEDWLASQPAPATRNLLMGSAAGEGKRTLVLANPGVDEVRASVKVITEQSVFAPAGVEEIRVAPGSVRRLVLSGSLLEAVSGALGLEVTSTGPVGATLRSFTDGDLSHAVSGTPFSADASVIVPEGRKQVVLAGAQSVGAVTVVGWSASGRQLVSTRAELRPGRGTVVRLPDRAVLVRVVPDGTPVTGAVVVSGNGTAVVPLRELVRNGLIPEMHPGLP